MALVVRLEHDIDFDLTARLANMAFAPSAAPFAADRIAWLYHRAFSQPTVVLGLFADDQKIGQAALVAQNLTVDGAPTRAVALMDVFILPAFRSRDAIGALYEAVERLCIETGIAILLAIPNEKAVRVNKRLLQLETTATLAIRAGLMPLVRPGLLRVSSAAREFGRPAALALFARYLPSGGTGLAWTAEQLWERLQDPSASYGLHATADLLLVSSQRSRRGVPFTLLCGFFARAGAVSLPAHVRAVTAAACRLQRRPLFIYVGINAAVPVPGMSVPERLRPSLMIVQARALSADGVALAFDHFECLDFDFA